MKKIYFWSKFVFLMKKSIFGQNFDFWAKIPILTEVLIFNG